MDRLLHLNVSFSVSYRERGKIMSADEWISRPVVLLLMAALFLTALPGISSSLENSLALQEIKGWKSSDVTTTELETPSGNQGTWFEKTYSRISDGHSILVIILRGPGTSWSGLPDAPVFSSDGSTGSGATYRTTTVAGFPAALETHPLTGRSLVVTAGKDETFTFETSYDDVDLQGFAEELIKSVKGNS